MDSDIAALLLLAALKSSTQPKVQIMQKSNITESEIETIAKTAIAGKGKVGNLSSLCAVISLVLNSQHTQKNWMCVASEDKGIAGELSICDGFVKFSFGPYYFIVISLKK